MKTVEEKAKAYDEAIERAKAMIKVAANQNEAIGFTNTIFPELKESENEQIRKHLIDCVNRTIPNATAFEKISKEKILAWLEKQRTSEEALQYLKENHSSAEMSDFQAAMNIAVAKAYDKGMKDGLKKQSKQRPIIEMKSPEESLGISSKEYNEIVNDCIYGESKSANKVEPKFHEGDWITNGLSYPMQISSIDDGMYYTHNDTVGGDIESMDKEYHLWTIEDAKPGDVLQLGEVTAIFKEYIGNENCRCYCSVCEGEFEIPSQEGDDNIYGCTNATPATKEQCDRLFVAMKDAGYEWNAEKKEPKKIHVIDEGKAEMDYCFTKMMNGEKVSSAWGEKEKEIIKRIASFVWKNRKGDTDEIFQQEQDVKWLNSLI